MLLAVCLSRIYCLHFDPLTGEAQVVKDAKSFLTLRLCCRSSLQPSCCLLPAQQHSPSSQELALHLLVSRSPVFHTAALQ